jgi:hypothetical protein
MEPVRISVTTFIGFRRCLMKTYAGIDLHSSNNYIGVMDQNQKRIFGRKMPNDMSVAFLRFSINDTQVPVNLCKYKSSPSVS